MKDGDLYGSRMITTMIKHIAFTMYPVKDLARARRFFEEDLGLTMTERFQNAWYEYDITGGCFAITTLPEGMTPSSNADGSIAFEVDNVDRAVETLRAKGMYVKAEPFSSPVCRLAVVVDPERNAVTSHKMATS